MKKFRRRLCVYFLTILGIGGFLAFSCLGTWKQIANNKKQKEELENRYENLLKSEEILEGQVVKLQDPDYVVKYAKEKYYFSKPGEVIIDMNFDDKGEE